MGDTFELNGRCALRYLIGSPAMIKLILLPCVGAQIHCRARVWDLGVKLKRILPPCPTQGMPIMPNKNKVQIHEWDTNTLKKVWENFKKVFVDNTSVWNFNSDNNWTCNKQVYQPLHPWYQGDVWNNCLHQCVGLWGRDVGAISWWHLTMVCFVKDHYLHKRNTIIILLYHSWVGWRSLEWLWP